MNENRGYECMRWLIIIALLSVMIVACAPVADEPVLTELPSNPVLPPLDAYEQTPEIELVRSVMESELTTLDEARAKAETRLRERARLNISEDELRVLVEEVAMLDAEIRFVELRARLAARDLS